MLLTIPPSWRGSVISGSDCDPMRYREIVEAGAAAEVWKQTERTADALRTLRSKQAKVADLKASARALPAGQERSRRLQAADRKDADARRV
ncbi:hypothetical protein [Phenylobacterium sp.]|uniref:hypothetical protein n=1 Tax=Phenylobacterium sp. TaxID=1871053 RepID=UPI0035B0339A